MEPAWRLNANDFLFLSSFLDDRHNNIKGGQSKENRKELKSLTAATCPYS